MCCCIVLYTIAGQMLEWVAMVMVQVALAGLNIFYKLAINDGMDMRVLIAYRFLFATAFLAPLAFFIERKRRPKMTWKILMQAFFCGLFGACLSQNFYVSSIKLTSATFTTAMTNLVPAITFVMALIFRLESLGIRTTSGRAKILGTTLGVGVGGAMLLTFVKGPEVHIWSTNVHLIKPNNDVADRSRQESDTRVMGSLLAVGCCFSYAIWLIIQAKMAKVYPFHYSSAALMCFTGSIQCVIFALCMQRDWAQWRLSFDIRLLAVSYAGIVGSGLIFTILTWCIKKRGPVYASIFNPLMLVIVAVLCSLMLNEKIYIGSILGATLIVIALYAVLWGKGREAKNVGKLPSSDLVDVVIIPKIEGSEIFLSGPDCQLEKEQNPSK